jgi:preprotein translocase subunit SecB
MQELVPSDPPAADPQPPQIIILSQYVKGLSFENPNAPKSITPTQGGQQPTTDIQIHVDAQSTSPIDFEVTLRIEGKAELSGMLLFKFELAFAGAVRIQNVPPEALQPVVLIECPRLLFPFAREIVSTTVRNGGFSALLLDPIDFAGLYRHRLAAGQQAAAA